MTKEKASSKLFWNLFFIYTANIIGKTSFSAATAALVSEEILTKTEAGIIGGGFWLNAFYVALGELAVLLVLGTILFYVIKNRRLEDVIR